MSSPKENAAHASTKQEDRRTTKRQREDRRADLRAEIAEAVKELNATDPLSDDFHPVRQRVNSLRLSLERMNADIKADKRYAKELLLPRPDTNPYRR